MEIMSTPLREPPARRRWSFGLRTMLLGVTAVAILVACTTFLCSPSSPLVSVTGRRETAAQANRNLWSCHVPPGASDVWYVTGFRATRVDCTMDEATFLGWCENRGWHASRIAAGERIYLYSERLKNAVTITAGLKFSVRFSQRSNCEGFYDALTHRAYVQSAF